jgi:hypothetical protein
MTPNPFHSHTAHGSNHTHPHAWQSLRNTNTISASLRTAVTIHCCRSQTHPARPANPSGRCLLLCL